MLFELHCHSTFSDGINTPKEIVDYAIKIGLNGISITDHDTIKGSIESLKYDTKDFTVIPGIEISSKEGHILGINIKTLIPKNLSAKDTIDTIHSTGGIAIAAHPYDRFRKGVGNLIFELPFDAVEISNGHTLGSTRDTRKICIITRLPMVGGSDAHTLQEIGQVKIEYKDDIIEAIKTGKITIISKPPPTLLLNHGIGMIKRKLLNKLK